VVEKETRHLALTHQRLFAQPLTRERLDKLETDVAAAEQLDAFVSRFARLQDTLGDKLLPALLQYLGEKVGPAIDNPDRAEKFSWLESADEWLLIRQLRNRRVHETIEDLTVLADALDSANKFVPSLLRTAENLLREARTERHHPQTN
jgi:hypothetical protein